jgi:uncharacterized membrane protein HdeD (DUF308 family)
MKILSIILLVVIFAISLFILVKGVFNIIYYVKNKKNGKEEKSNK